MPRSLLQAASAAVAITAARTRAARGRHATLRGSFLSPDVIIVGPDGSASVPEVAYFRYAGRAAGPAPARLPDTDVHRPSRRRAVLGSVGDGAAARSPVVGHADVHGLLGSAQRAPPALPGGDDAGARAALGLEHRLGNRGERAARRRDLRGVLRVSLHRMAGPWRHAAVAAAGRLGLPVLAGPVGE